MRYTLIIIAVVILFAACKKDKYTTAPQISFKSINPTTLSGNIDFNKQVLPVITFHITDAEGDIGFVNGKDTAYIYVKNLLANTMDSFKFPNLSNITTKKFECDVSVTPKTVLQQGPRPRPKTDSLFFEVYVKDFAKHKSNTFVTPTPVLIHFQ